MKKTTTYSTVSRNYGQVKIEDAATEINRLNAAGSGKWKKDFSDYLYVSDETDPNVQNPCRLKPGYCWLIKY